MKRIVCARCGEAKAPEEYYIKRGRRSNTCKKCENSYRNSLRCIDKADLYGECPTPEILKPDYWVFCRKEK